MVAWKSVSRLLRCRSEKWSTALGNESVVLVKRVEAVIRSEIARLRDLDAKLSDLILSRSKILSQSTPIIISSLASSSSTSLKHQYSSVQPRRWYVPDSRTLSLPRGPNVSAALYGQLRAEISMWLMATSNTTAFLGKRSQNKQNSCSHQIHCFLVQRSLSTYD